MPIVSIHRGSVTLQTITDGQQTVTGTIDFGAGTEVTLDPTVYNRRGRYILFSYGTLLNFANLTVNGADLVGLGFTTGSPVNDTTNSRITVNVT